MMLLIGIVLWLILSVPLGIVVGKAINRGNNIVSEHEATLDDLLGGVKE